METVDWPHRQTQVFPAQIGLTRAYNVPKKTFEEVTHPKIASHQALLTVEFFKNGLLCKEDAPF